MDKIRKKQIDIYKLEVIVLTQMCVSHIDPDDTKAFERCRELNLSSNLITRWSDIIDILTRFPMLESLILWDNHLEPLQRDEAEQAQITSPVLQLVLNGCRISDETANLVPVLFPRLEELHMASNCFTSFRPPLSCRLRKLHIQENEIVDFNRLHALKDLPCLQFLSVFKCGFEGVSLPTDVGFSALETLLIHDNQFSTWETISQLARLPSLKKLHIKGLMPGAHGMSVREMTIAKMPLLVELDRCDISPVERRSSEVLFLNRFGHEPILEIHREDIKRLIQRYGPPDPENLSNGLKTNLKFLKLTLQYGEQQQQRCISLELSIRALVGMASRIFGFSPDEVRVELRRKNFAVERIDRRRTNLLQQFDLTNDDVVAFVDE
ncbi:CAP-Gly domain-containing protein [Aphelenchoides avenae]|nr:CAP-Gly domain-containing protein [Aphelenchus avenae]